MKIAIVEDEAKEQEIIVKYIGEWAEARRELVEFRCFPSSESFLFAWEDGKDYRLLVLDIEMGGMNGLGLAEKVRLEDREVRHRVRRIHAARIRCVGASLSD